MVRHWPTPLKLSSAKPMGSMREWQTALREWEHVLPADADPEEVAKVQKKLESAKVRLAKEGAAIKQQ